MARIPKVKRLDETIALYSVKPTPRVRRVRVRKAASIPSQEIPTVSPTREYCTSTPPISTSARVTPNRANSETTIAAATITLSLSRSVRWKRRPHVAAARTGASTVGVIEPDVKASEERGLRRRPTRRGSSAVMAPLNSVIGGSRNAEPGSWCRVCSGWT